MATAFYRKYRPDNFENIVGQNHVIDVLRNQIKDNKISHAYIFSGVRGTGKTSTAKVFARAVNCQNYDDVKGPCNKCESCINNEMDTVEIDAASNNSVDNIRDLKENIMYQPSFGRYKVYIIDEVHMLSTGAFNALLKTLEEPPEHVIFILATTEIQKIPATILSRCQKFEFRKIDKDQIKNRLKEILDSENIPYDEEALQYISSISDGGLRDAISMLDQASSFEKVNREAVEFILGNTSIENVDSFLEGYSSQDAEKCLQITVNIIEDSTDIKKFPMQIINRLRDIIYIQNRVEKEDIINMESVKALSEKIKPEDASNLIVSLSEIENRMKFSMTPDILFQAFAVKICKTVNTSDSGEEINLLLNRIEQLENRINSLENRQSAPAYQYTNKPPDDTAPVGNIKRPTVNQIQQKDIIPEEEQRQIEYIRNLEGNIISELKDRRCAPIGAFYKQGNVRRYVNGAVYISYSREHSFHKKQIEAEDKLGILEEVLSMLLNRRTAAVIIFDDEIINPDQNKQEETPVEKLKKVFGEGVDLEIIKE